MAFRDQMPGWVRPNALAGLLAFAIVAGVAIFGCATVLDGKVPTAVDYFDMATAAQTVGEAKATAAAPLVQHTLPLEQEFKPVVVETDAFPHARAAPMLITRYDPAAIAELKQAVSERIVVDDASPWHDGKKQTYRTMCVRLCDGAYFPISFATTRRYFARDEAQCATRCGSPARLFVFPNPGGSPDLMRDLNGRSYVTLPTAFQFRKGAVASCSCRSEPWEAASRERHRFYALQSDLAAGKAVDMAELVSLRRRYATAVATPLTAAAASRPRAAAPSGAVTNAALSPVAQVIELSVHGIAAGKAPAFPHIAAHVAASQMDVPVALPLVQPLATLVGASRDEGDSAVASEPPLPIRSAAVRTDAASNNDMVARLSRSKIRSQRQGTNRRLVGSLTNEAQATAAQQRSGQMSKQLMKHAIWGIGPNARGAPRGTSAYDTFVRNFF